MRRLAVLLCVLASCAHRPPPSTEPAPPVPPSSTRIEPRAPSPPPPAAKPGAPFTLLAGGDVTVGHHYQTYFDEQVAQGRSREEMFAYGFAGVRAAADQADLFVVNLECPFTEGGEKLPKNFNFRARPELVNVLLAGGVDAVSLANNHMMDYGPTGVLDTLATLEAAGIPYFGAGRNMAEARRPALLEVRGTRLALLGYFFLGGRNIEPPEVYATETRPGVAGHFSDVELMEQMLLEDIRAARGQADLVIPFFHWGREGTHLLEPYQLRLARAAIDAGAAAVLGAHPHVLQPMELYRGAPVIYSLGNFVFGGNWNPRDKRAALFKGRFGPSGYLGGEVIPLHTDRFPARPFQPHLLQGADAEAVLRLLADSSSGLPAMLPELEAWRPDLSAP